MAQTWKIPFKAFNGDDLAVYIGTSIDYAECTTLKGGAEPFVTEMDDSDDLFTPVRTQTGYVRFIDETGDTLREMIPEKENTTKVLLAKEDQVWDIVDWTDPDEGESEPIYGWTTHRTTLWQGYVQAQMFAQPWVTPPFEAELPVIDLLGALANTKRITGAEVRTFGRILSTEMSNINAVAYFANNNYTSDSYDCRDLGGAAFQGNWMKRNEDNQEYEKFTAMERLTDICTFFGWSCVCVGTKIYFCAPDDAEVMRDVVMSSVANTAYLSRERINIETKRLEDFTVKRNDGDVGLSRSRGKITVTSNANSNNSKIFSVQWPGEFISLEAGFNPYWSETSKERHAWHSFRSGFDVECYQYVGNTRQSPEKDILNYNKTHQEMSTAMAGANMIYDTRIPVGRSALRREGLASRILFCGTPMSSRSAAFKITSHDHYDFSSEAALKISGKVKISKSFTDDFVDSDWDTGYVSRITATIKIGSKVIETMINIDPDGNFYTPYSDIATPELWLPHSDGALFFFDSVVCGTVSVEIKTQTIHANSGSGYLPYFAIEDFAVERVQPWRIDSKTAYKQTYEYSDTASTYSTDDVDIDLNLSSPPSDYKGNGLGLTRYVGGQPYVIPMRHGNPEESLLYRMKAWYSKAHETITVTIGIDYDLKPCDKFTYHDELYYILAMNYQWRDSTMTLKLIKA